jgi:uncharacterized lipoprotein YehR (DUF1307 family)
MLLKGIFSRVFLSKGKRVFTSRFFKNYTKDSVQMNSGGCDYNPPKNAKLFSLDANHSPSNKTIIGYEDEIERTAQPGEKIIYSTNVNGTEITAKIHFTFDGKINIISNGDVIVNEGSENAVKYQSLNASLQQLITKINTELAKAQPKQGQTIAPVVQDFSSSIVDRFKV